VQTKYSYGLPFDVVQKFDIPSVLRYLLGKIIKRLTYI